MKIEHAPHLQQQTNGEQDALFPTSQVYEPKTEDIIILSENVSSRFNSSKEKTYEDKVEASIRNAQWEFAQSIDFKVKNELVAQLFTEEGPIEGVFNIVKVANVLQDEMTHEQSRNLQAAHYVKQVLLPEAEQHENILFTQVRNLDPIRQKFSSADIENLQARCETYAAMSDYISRVTPQDENEFFELAGLYIDRLKYTAQAEHVAILEERVRTAQYENSELNKTIKDLKRELSERDLQLLDASLAHKPLPVEELTRKARELAHAS